LLLVLKLADPRCGSTRALASRPLYVGKTLSIHDSTFPIERPEMTAVYGFLTTRAAVLTRSCRTTSACHLE